MRRIAILLLAAACGGSVPGKPPVFPARASELHYEGRFNLDDPASPLFELPGSAVWVRFTGGSVSVTLGERSLEHDDYGAVAHNWYDVSVDGKPAPPVVALEGVNPYTLATGLSGGEHLLVLRKRTEAYVGEARVLEVELAPGGKLLPVAPPQRRLEILGDSITAGFGVDGPDGNCLFSPSTENYSHSYAALTAQALGADHVAVAVTGAGVYRNYDGSVANNMGDLYLRSLPTHASDRWDFSRWTPDAVVIDLGTNDFMAGDPGSAAFTAAYKALIAKVRGNYPSALIVVALGPMLSDYYPKGAQALTQSRAYVTAMVHDLNAAGDAKVKLLEFPNQDQAASFGCRFHPSAATHQQMAAQLTAFLRQQLGW